MDIVYDHIGHIERSIEHKRFIKTLPKESQSIYCLSVFEKMTNRQIANCLGISETRVSRLLKESKGKLQLFLK